MDHADKTDGSYWTKRRRVHANVVESFASILSEDLDISENETDANFDLVSDNSLQGPLPSEHSSTDALHHAKPVTPEPVTPEAEPIMSLSDSSIDADNDASDSSGSSETDSIRNDLANWACKYSIPLVAVSALLGVLQPRFPDLPKDARALLKTPTNVTLEHLAGGEYHHLGISAGILAQLESHQPDVVTLLQHIRLQINIDGLPLFKSSNKQLWPIQGMIENMPCKSPFIIGLYFGVTKPTDLSAFLNRFVSEMVDLERDGISFQDSHYSVSISAMICDAPARAYLKNVKGHSGYSGCERCVQSGVYRNKVTFPEVDSALRTDAQFDEMSDEDHHLGASPLSRLSIGMVSQFPLDYMHLVCLGVTRRLLLLWISGPLAVRLGSNMIKMISRSLTTLARNVPREFARKPRSLNEIKRWKATELRQFLLYTGPVVLRGKLSTAMYNNYLLFFTGIYILLSPALCIGFTDFAQEMLVSFIQHFSEIYGADMLVYNVHCLVHLADDCRRYGPLDNVSAFPFENHLHSIKKLVRKPQHVIQQIVRRLAESNHRCNQQQANHYGQIHTAGPLPHALLSTHCVQYKSINTAAFYISTSDGNNCCGIGNDIAIVKNIVLHNDVTYVIVHKCLERKDFFSYPVHSSFLGIHEVLKMSDCLEIVPLSQVEFKYVCLPYRNRDVVIPLLHTCSQ